MEKIIVESLTQDYGHGRGVFDVSFKVHDGEVFGFLGPNGAGKSTTIRHLMGFSKPQSGRTTILGMESFDNYYKFMNSVGYLPGEIALPSGLSGYEFIDMMMKLKKVNDATRLKYLLELFKFDPIGETKRMSLGDKRKLAIVTAFLNDPEVLILDEPTSGLDLEMQQTFIEFIKEEKKRGKTILLSSHIFSEVDACCDRIAIIKDGRIVSQFNASDLKHNSDKIYEVKFTSQKQKQSFKKKWEKSSSFNIIDENEEGNYIKIAVNDIKINELIKALSGCEIENFLHLQESLEQYFMKYYKEEKNFGGAL